MSLMSDKLKIHLYLEYTVCAISSYTGMFIFPFTPNVIKMPQVKHDTGIWQGQKGRQIRMSVTDTER